MSNDANDQHVSFRLDKNCSQFGQEIWAVAPRLKVNKNGRHIISRVANDYEVVRGEICGLHYLYSPKAGEYEWTCDIACKASDEEEGLARFIHSLETKYIYVSQQAAEQGLTKLINMQAQ